MKRGTARGVAAVAALLAIVWANFFLRSSLDQAGKHLYAFLPYFYPAAEQKLFHQSFPLWRLFLPLHDISGAWAGSLIVTHLIEMRIGVPQTWYLFNALLVIGSFVISWAAFRSLPLSYTFAIAMGFGTHLYHTYLVPGTMAAPLILVLYEFLLLCSYRVVAGERHRRAWAAAFAVTAVMTALSYEGWLDVAAFALVAGPLFALLAARRAPAIARRALAVTVAFAVLAAVYVVVKTRFGYGQVPGSESDVVFNYPTWAPAVEDVASNLITQLYMTVTNFLPPVFLSSTALFTLGADKLVALQARYHEAYSYLVPMHYLFLWRYAAGATALATLAAVAVLVGRSWRAPTADRLAGLTFLMMMLLAGSTHAIVKIRPMKTVPVMSYHVMFGVIGVSLLIAYGVMMIWRDWRSLVTRVLATGVVWSVIVYGALARPIMLNHMAAEVGVPGIYPNPMNTFRAMLHLREDPSGDLTGYRLVKYAPPGASDAVVQAAPAPPPAPPSSEGERPLGDVLDKLPTPVITLAAWDALPNVKVTPVDGGFELDGNTAGGYQVMSPAIAVTPGSTLLVKATGTVRKGHVCFGALDQAQQKWLHSPAAPESEFLLNTGTNRSVRLVFATCAGTTDAPQFFVQSISYAVLTPDAGNR